jgi:hypothetical protein
MTHDDQQDLPRARAQFQQTVNELLAVKQELARQEQTFTLLQRLSPEVAQRIGRSLFDQMLKTQCDRAAEVATREFPEYLREVLQGRAEGGRSP